MGNLNYLYKKNLYQKNYPNDSIILRFLENPTVTIIFSQRNNHFPIGYLESNVYNNLSGELVTKK